MKLLHSAVAAAVALLTMAPLAANAAATLKLEDLVTPASVTVSDGGAGDVNPLGNVVTYIGGVGNWLINVSTGQGANVFPGQVFGVDLNSLNTSVGAGTLKVSFTQTDLTNDSTFFQGLIGGTTHGSVSYAFYRDLGNAAFGTSELIFDGTGTVGAFSGNGGTTVAMGSPYSLTLVVEINHRSAGSTSFDFSGETPEPGTLALVSLALLGAGAVARRRS